MLLALAFTMLVMMLGVGLRAVAPVFRWLYIPASVLAGAIGLLVIQSASSAASPPVVEAFQSVSATLRQWPSWLIAVVFAGMMLQRRSDAGDDEGGSSRTANRVARQGLMVWIIVLGQTAVGVMTTWLLIQPWFDVPSSFGMLIETGFAGGHGTAAAMGQVCSHPSIQFAEGLDLGVLMATCGLVYGIASGIIWINVAVRCGWVSSERVTASSRTSPSQENLPSRNIWLARAKRVPPQLLWLAAAFSVGWLLQQAVVLAAACVDHSIGLTANSAGVTEQFQATSNVLSDRLSASQLLDFPLFIYTLFGGMIVGRMVATIGWQHTIDSEVIDWLTGIAMDVLIVAAITSLNLNAVARLLTPFGILFAAGVIWTSVCLLLLSRVVLQREDWFQLGIINYGMSTGTTATGFVLLRVIDPALKTNAASDYALAVPISAPFIGGGLLTIALPLLVLSRVNIAWPAIALTIIVTCMIAWAVRGKRKQNSTDP
jgi:ESS family glutamate:Na+ symporter